MLLVTSLLSSAFRCCSSPISHRVCFSPSQEVQEVVEEERWEQQQQRVTPSCEWSWNEKEEKLQKEKYQISMLLSTKILGSLNNTKTNFFRNCKASWICWDFNLANSHYNQNSEHDTYHQVYSSSWMSQVSCDLKYIQAKRPVVMCVKSEKESTITWMRKYRW